jgi:hypothetical protein
VGLLLGGDAGGDASALSAIVTSPDAFYGYITTSLLPQLFLPEAPDDDGAPLSPDAAARREARRGTVNTYGRMLGGLRLAQERSEAADCPFASLFPALSSGRPCYPDDSFSIAPYGDAPEVAAAANVSGAFAPSRVQVEDAARADTLDPFELIIPSGATLEAATAMVAALRAGGWVDAATKHVHVELGVLNMDIMAWARALLTVSFTRGGRVESTVTVRSLPIDPYHSLSRLWFFDVLNLVYLVVIVGLLLINIARVARRVATLRSDGYGVESFLAIFDAWLVIDWGATACYLATAISWAEVVVTLHRLQVVVAGAAWVGPSLGEDTTRLHGYLGSALANYWEAKTAACATLFFLTLRMFWQFSLQPKLAVMTECLSRGLSDMLHFGVLFLVIMASYTVWGHVAFGSQAHDWRTLGDAGFAVIRFAMYDYDLAVRARCGWGLG